MATSKGQQHSHGHSPGGNMGSGPAIKINESATSHFGKADHMHNPHNKSHINEYGR